MKESREGTRAGVLGGVGVRRGPGRQVILYTLRCCRPATHPDPSIKLTYIVLYTKYTASGEKITAWCGIGVVLRVWYHIRGAASEDLSSGPREPPIPALCSRFSLLEGENTNLVFRFISFFMWKICFIVFQIHV